MARVSDMLVPGHPDPEPEEYLIERGVEESGFDQELDGVGAET